MPTLIRTAAQNATYRRWSLDLLRCAARLRRSGNRDAARLLRLGAMYYFWRTLGPRRSWAKGIERVQKWSFGQYTETNCWECMRFHRHQLPVLLRKLELHRCGEPDGMWLARDEVGVTQSELLRAEGAALYTSNSAVLTQHVA